MINVNSQIILRVSNIKYISDMTSTSIRFESLHIESESDDDSKYSWRMTEDKKDNKSQYVCPKRIGTRQDSSHKYYSFQDSKTKNNKNVKKILCKNVVTSNVCGYGNKCLYAHKLEEQSIDNERKHAYEILMGTDDLSNIDLQKDHSLYRSLLGLTTLCAECDKNKCTGGYNCKYGACMKIYHVCQRDLNYGDCLTSCGKVHLSKRGLKSFYVGSSTKQLNNQNIQGTLLSPDFFRRFDTQSNKDDDLDDLSDISENSSESDQTDECDQSIFLKIKVE